MSMGRGLAVFRLHSGIFFLGTTLCTVLFSSCVSTPSIQPVAVPIPVQFTEALAEHFSYDPVNHLLRVSTLGSTNRTYYYKLPEGEISSLALADDGWTHYEQQIASNYQPLTVIRWHDKVLIPIKSTQFKAAAYDAQRETFFLQFKDGLLRQYEHFPRELYEKFMDAPIKGSIYKGFITEYYSSSPAVNIPELPEGFERVMIMPLGNSITQADAQHNSYRRPLWRKLLEAGYYTNFIGSQSLNSKGPAPKQDFDTDHEGHYGWTIERVVKKIDQWARDFTPDIALIHLGTNDLALGRDIPDILNDFDTVAATFRKYNPTVTLLIAQIIPANRAELASMGDFNEALKTFGRGIHQAKSPVVIVDLNTGMDVGKDLFDGVHPNERGEVKMADNWFKALVPLLPESTRIHTRK
jgi:hypothetical protein